jgi:hypothetical protein
VSDPAGGPRPSTRVSTWRIWTGAAVLAGLLLMGILLVPVYVRNLELEEFLREAQPTSDDMLRQMTLDKGRSLGLDIAPDHLEIRRSPTGGSTAVRYVVRVTLPLYTVDLHFSSNTKALSR